eukprot:m.225485 g.225485  ORF g.225485 m.225485 type:complete len:83 (-) comp15957_c4_seq10:1456-1704(-)
MYKISTVCLSTSPLKTSYDKGTPCSAAQHNLKFLLALNCNLWDFKNFHRAKDMSDTKKIFWSQGNIPVDFFQETWYYEIRKQ